MKRTLVKVAIASFPLLAIALNYLITKLIEALPDLFENLSREVLMTLPGIGISTAVILVILAGIFSLYLTKSWGYRILSSLLFLVSFASVGFAWLSFIGFPDERCGDFMMTNDVFQELDQVVDEGKTWTLVYQEKGAMGDGYHPMIEFDVDPKPKRRVYKCEDSKPILEIWLDKKPKHGRIDLGRNQVILTYPNGKSEKIDFAVERRSGD